MSDSHACGRSTAHQGGNLRTKGSRNNNSLFWNADLSRLAALRKLERYQIFLRFRALPDGHLDAPKSGTDYFANPEVAGNRFKVPFGSLVLLLWVAVSPCAAWADLVAAVLPSGRSVQVGDTATAFATVINTGSSTAEGCRISPVTRVPAAFGYQTTNRTTNALTGSPNAPIDIPAGGLQTFLIAFTPSEVFDATDVALRFNCDNTAPAPVVSGLNTLLLSAANTPVPDIVALAATLGGDGTVTIFGATDTGAFAVSTVNVGASGMITVTPATQIVGMPVRLTICETNPVDSTCRASPASEVSVQIDSGDTPTFAVFVQGTGFVSFDPALHRVLVRFDDARGITRGATSVAVRTEIGPGACVNIAGAWDVTETARSACTVEGETETQTDSDMRTVVIEQSGCSVRYTAAFGVPREGVVEGARIHVSGPAAIPFSDNVSFTQNIFAAEGTLMGDQITLSGEGTAIGTADGIAFSCRVTSTGTLLRAIEPPPVAFDGIWTGTAVSTTPTDSFGDECGSASMTMNVRNAQISGTATDNWGDTYRMDGSVEPDGTVTAAFIAGGDVGSLSGRLSGNSGGGTWQDVFGCRGTWNVTRR